MNTHFFFFISFFSLILFSDWKFIDRKCIEFIYSQYISSIFALFLSGQKLNYFDIWLTFKDFYKYETISFQIPNINDYWIFIRWQLKEWNIRPTNAFNDESTRVVVVADIKGLLEKNMHILLFDLCQNKLQADFYWNKFILVFHSRCFIKLIIL